MKYDGKWIRAYRWHSINIVPQWNCIPIHSDEYPYTQESSMLELVLFGTVIHVSLPIKLPGMGCRLIGPLWSRKKKRWY